MSYASVFLFMLCYIVLPKTQDTHFVSFDQDKSKVIWTLEDKGRASLYFTIRDGFHIQDPNASSEYLIPTTFSITSTHLTLEDSKYKFTPHTITFPDGSVLKTLEGTFVLTLSFSKNDMSKNQDVLEGILDYQTCDERKCYFPRSLPIKVNLYPNE